MVYTPAFVTTGALTASSFIGQTSSSASRSAVCSASRSKVTVAALEDWGAGLKSDPLYGPKIGDGVVLNLEGAPEDLSSRSFATVLPRTWAGEIPSSGVFDLAKDKGAVATREINIFPDDPEDAAKFSVFFQSIQEERKAALQGLPLPDNGGDSNFPMSTLTDVECIEFWK